MAEKMAEKVIKHPSSRRFQSDVYARFTALRKQHEAATNRAWLGALVTFTDQEIGAIGEMLCPNDYALLKLAGRNIEMPKCVRRIMND